MLYLIVLACLFNFNQIGNHSSGISASSERARFYPIVDTSVQKNARLVLTLDLENTFQTVHSFGASDCWTIKYIGDWDNVDKKNKIADLLFSLDTLKDGQPEGIGLSLWRFNIGAGSFEQGKNSGIATDWRREECFLNSDGTYNWNKQSGQQWFLQAAKKRKVKYTLGFSVSPPVYMTKNEKAFNGTKGTSMNIQKNKMDDYADFLAKVTKHFHFDYISPMNEPQWSWGDGKASQEGTQATNREIASLVQLLAPKLFGSSARVIIGEAAEWDFLYGRNNDGRGNQIAQFFSPSSSNYIADLPHVEKAISAHSYFTTCPDDKLVKVRQWVAEKINQVDPGLETWQTEFGVLGNICKKYSGAPRHTGIDYGLYIAKVIHNDLTIANVSSWQWWLAVNPYNYSDGLVYINDPSGAIDVDLCKKDGVIVESKQLWALGNYSRFIRPGMKRVAASIAGLTDPVRAASSLMVSAFKDQGKKLLVIVLVNVTDQTKTIQLDNNSHLKIKNNLLNAYTTSADKNLKRLYMRANNIIIDPQSIVTITGEYQ